MKNDPGEAFFHQTLRLHGFSDEMSLSLWGERQVSRQRCFRRELCYYTTYADELQLDPSLNCPFADAVRKLAAVMEYMFRTKRKTAAVVHGVSTAVSTLGSYVYERALSESRVIHGLNKSFAQERPRVKRQLQLSWEIGRLWSWVRGLPPIQSRSHMLLVQSTIVSIRGLTGLRLSEAHQFSRKKKQLSKDGRRLSFAVRLKGRTYYEYVEYRGTADGTGAADRRLATTVYAGQRLVLDSAGRI